MKSLDKEDVQIRYGMIVFSVLAILVLTSACNVAPLKTPLQQCASACKNGDLDSFQDDIISCECASK